MDEDAGQDGVPLLDMMDGKKTPGSVGNVGDAIFSLQAEDYSRATTSSKVVTHDDIELCCEFLQRSDIDELSDGQLAQLNAFYATQLERTLNALKMRRGKGTGNIDLIDD